MPDFLIKAWDGFLGGLSRSFVVHGEAGEHILSTTGFPEGDPMSTVAVTIIDWAWHLYLQHYAPAAIPSSFVDNFSCTARDVEGLAQALACTRSFADMWSLEIDGGFFLAVAQEVGSSSSGQAGHAASKGLGESSSWGRRGWGHYGPRPHRP